MRAAHSAWSKSCRMVNTFVMGRRGSRDCTCARTVPTAGAGSPSVRTCRVTPVSGCWAKGR